MRGSSMWTCQCLTEPRIELRYAAAHGRPVPTQGGPNGPFPFPLPPALLPPNSMLPRNDAAELDFPPKAPEGGPQVSKRMRNEDISRSRLRLRGYGVEGRLGLDLSPAKSRLRTIRAMIPQRVVRHD